MNIQIPYDLLDDYETIAVETGKDFFQLVVRYEEANIVVTLNENSVESYHLRSVSSDGVNKGKIILPKLLDFFEGLGFKGIYNKIKSWEL